MLLHHLPATEKIKQGFIVTKSGDIRTAWSLKDHKMPQCPLTISTAADGQIGRAQCACVAELRLIRCLLPWLLSTLSDSSVQTCICCSRWLHHPGSTGPLPQHWQRRTLPFGQRNEIPSALESQVPGSPSSYPETAHAVPVGSRREMTPLRSQLEHGAVVSLWNITWNKASCETKAKVVGTVVAELRCFDGRLSPCCA